MQPPLVNHVSDTFLCKGTWNLNHKNTAAKCMQKNITIELKIETKKMKEHIYISINAKKSVNLLVLLKN